LSITIIKKDRVFISAAVAALCIWTTIAAAMAAGPREGKMIDVEKTAERLRRHLTALTETIGDRSVQRPDNLERAAGYIEEVLSEMGLSVERQPFQYKGLTVANLISDIGPAGAPGKRYILGAHYDTVAGTPGADDNASAVAVMLETGRALVEMGARMPKSMAVRLAAFTLEEPPAFGTSKMGSKHYAKTARKTGERIDGMICLEMVGYACHQPGCQEYPFPLGLRGYPDIGNFIGIVGNMKARGFSRDLERAFRENPDLPVIRLTVPFNGKILPPVRLSDHASFWDQGYGAVMVTDTSFYRNPHYHLPSDTMNTLDYRYMAELVESLTRFFASRADGG
jgi:hypothetical protein